MDKGAIGKNKILAIRKREVEPWIYSYSDLTTNLLALFIMLFIVFNRGEDAKQKLQEALGVYSGAETTEPTEKPDNERELPLAAPEMHEARRIVSDYVRRNALDTKVSLETLKNGVELTFEGSIVFDTGTAGLNDDAYPALRHIAALAKLLPNRYILDIEGHTDAVPPSGAGYRTNWALSAARAARVAEYIIETGFPEQRVRAIGYGSSRPIDSNGESDLNRRVVVKISAESKGGEK